MNVHVRKISLCESRHEMPDTCEGYIFPHTVNLNNLEDVEQQADRVVCQCKCDGVDLHVYVTGIQAPLVAVINSANKRKVRLVLWHWNPTTKQYYPQKIYQELEEQK